MPADRGAGVAFRLRFTPGSSPPVARARSRRKTRRRERQVDAVTNDAVGPSAPTRLHRSGNGPTPEVRAFATGALHSAAGAWRKRGEPAGPTACACRSATVRLRTGNRVVRQRELACVIGRVGVRNRTRRACSSNCPPCVPPAVFNKRRNHRRPDRGRTTPLVVGPCRPGWAAGARRQERDAPDLSVSCGSPSSGARRPPRRGRAAGQPSERHTARIAAMTSAKMTPPANTPSRMPRAAVRGSCRGTGPSKEICVCARRWRSWVVGESSSMMHSHRATRLGPPTRTPCPEGCLRGARLADAWRGLSPNVEQDACHMSTSPPIQ